jgi:uncharacterized membrane protein YkvI
VRRVNPIVAVLDWAEHALEAASLARVVIAVAALAATVLLIVEMFDAPAWLGVLIIMAGLGACGAAVAVTVTDKEHGRD